MTDRIEIHHIDRDRHNNRPYNLFRTVRTKHKELHDQLAFLFKEWRLVDLKFTTEQEIMQHLISTGELIFEPEYPRYRIQPRKDTPLGQYEEILKDIGITPAYVKPPFDIAQALAQFRILPKARAFFEKDVCLNRPVRSAMLRTTTTYLVPEERERESGEDVNGPD